LIIFSEFVFQIKVVLSAVEENWLNQAPQPTLDKAQALRVKSEDLSELSESECSTICDLADYTKQKVKID
jgi:hypothetical protein